MLIWKKGDPATSKKVIVQVQDSNPIELSHAQSTIPEFSPQLKTIKPGFEYEVEITPSDTSKILTGKIELEGNTHAKPKPIMVMVR